MQLVCQGINNSKGKQLFYFYEFKASRWVFKYQEQLLTEEDLYDRLMISKVTVDYAIIDLNKVYRNTFYAYSPHTIVVVSPTAVWHFFSRMWLVGQETCMELATTTEQEAQVFDDYEAKYTFLNNLYEMNEREEAEHYYEQWQLGVDLKDHMMQYFIRTMEDFKEEIFNYFLLKPLLNKRILL